MIVLCSLSLNMLFSCEHVQAAEFYRRQQRERRLRGLRSLRCLLFKGLGIGVWLRPRRAKNSVSKKICTQENNTLILCVAARPEVTEPNTCAVLLRAPHLPSVIAVSHPKPLLVAAVGRGRLVSIRIVYLCDDFQPLNFTGARRGSRGKNSLHGLSLRSLRTPVRWLGFGCGVSRGRKSSGQSPPENAPRVNSRVPRR